MRQLSIDSHDIQLLPDWLAELKELRTLSVGGCGALSALPSTLTTLPCLESLSVNNSGVLSLPGTLPALTDLFYGAWNSNEANLHFGRHGGYQHQPKLARLSARIYDDSEGVRWSGAEDWSDGGLRGLRVLKLSRPLRGPLPKNFHEYQELHSLTLRLDGQQAWGEAALERLGDLPKLQLLILEDKSGDCDHMYEVLAPWFASLHERWPYVLIQADLGQFSLLSPEENERLKTLSMTLTAKATTADMERQIIEGIAEAKKLMADALENRSPLWFDARAWELLQHSTLAAEAGLARSAQDPTDKALKIQQVAELAQEILDMNRWTADNRMLVASPLYEKAEVYQVWHLLMHPTRTPEHVLEAGQRLDALAFTVFYCEGEYVSLRKLHATAAAEIAG